MKPITLTHENVSIIVRELIIYVLECQVRHDSIKTQNIDDYVRKIMQDYAAAD